MIKVNNKCFLILVFMANIALSNTLFAQYYSNGGVSFSIGWSGFDSSMSWANKPLKKSWNTGDQINFAVGYLRALGYNLWWHNRGIFGFGSADKVSEDGQKSKTVASINAMTSLRYNFMTYGFRPFVQGSISYLQFLSIKDTQIVSDNHHPIWVGLSPGVGFEWIFYDDMGLQLQLDYLMYINFFDPFKQSYVASISYNIYF